MVKTIHCSECFKEITMFDDMRNLMVKGGRIVSRITCTRCLERNHPEEYAAQIANEKRWIEETAAAKKKREERKQTW